MRSLRWAPDFTIIHLNDTIRQRGWIANLCVRSMQIIANGFILEHRHPRDALTETGARIQQSLASPQAEVALELATSMQEFIARPAGRCHLDG